MMYSYKEETRKERKRKRMEQSQIKAYKKKPKNRKRKSDGVIPKQIYILKKFIPKEKVRKSVKRPLFRE